MLKNNFTHYEINKRKLNFYILMIIPVSIK